MPYTLAQAAQPLAIAEREYATAAEVRFTLMTSCIGVIGINGQQATGVHLSIYSETGTAFNNDAADAAVVALGAYNRVMVIGRTNTWGITDAVSASYNYLLGRMTTAQVVPGVFNFADGVYGLRIQQNGDLQIYADGGYIDID